MSASRKVDGHDQEEDVAGAVEERQRVMLSVLAGEVMMAEAARRHGVADATVAKWRDRFVEVSEVAAFGEGALLVTYQAYETAETSTPAQQS